MPKTVEIEIFNIARTQVDPEEVKKWLDRLGVSEEFDQEAANLALGDPAWLIALAAKRCYMSFEPGLNPNVTKVRKDYTDYFDNILKSRHGSVLEHASYSYAIEGVSRVFTAEMNRHRAGWSPSEGSLRFIRFDRDIPYWLPLSLRENEDDEPSLARKKAHSRDIFDEVFSFIEEKYEELLNIWDMQEGKDFSYKKKVTSALRRIVPLGVATGGVWTGNIRALRHVIATRTDPSAEEEIMHVFKLIADDVIQREPILFQDFNRETSQPKYLKV